MNQVANVSKTGTAIQQSKLFEALPDEWDDLSAGVSIGFPIIGIKAGKWHYRYKGDDQIIMDNTGRFPAPAFHVVILKAQKELSRTFYPGGYVEGVNNPPSCWSSNGVAPDQSVLDPINPVCATCPNAAWGSGATPAAPKAQACQQRRRTVVVPYSTDLTNEGGGGPCLLSVPPGSLTNFVAFSDHLKNARAHYASVITEMSFSQDPGVAFPKIEFTVVGSLDDDQAGVIIHMRDHEAVARILNTPMIPAETAETPPETPLANTAPPPAAAPRPAPTPQPATQAPPVAQVPIRAQAPPPSPHAPQRPKPSAVVPPAQTAKPPVPPTAAPPPRVVIPVGGHPVNRPAPAGANGAGTAIGAAIAKPAAPPVSQRVVQATERHMAAAPPQQSDGEEHQGEPEPEVVEGQLPDDMAAEFDALMAAT